MSAQAIAIAVVVGLVAGWLATFVIGGGGSALRYIVFGIIGALVGNFLFVMFNVHLSIVEPVITQIITAAIGAIVLVLVARVITRV
jgi:uncharacterized membrane protein YeaQ/YmgE (transglycosylase-associated protein family)